MPFARSAAFGTLSVIMAQASGCLVAPFVPSIISVNLSQSAALDILYGFDGEPSPISVPCADALLAKSRKAVIKMLNKIYRFTPPRCLFVKSDKLFHFLYD